MKEIAKELGISYSTVSRVLNDKQTGLVSAATRERITQAAERMGYRPSRIAQALKGERTQLVGVFLPDGKDYFFQDVLINLHHVVEESGFELIPFPSSVEKVGENWLRLLHWDLDGVFVFDYVFYVEGLGDALPLHRGYIPPMVGMFNRRSQLRDHVTIDFRPALETLLTHFVQQGCRSIGYIALPISFRPEEERFAVYTEFARSHGIRTLHLPLPPSEDLCDAAHRAMRAHIVTGRPLPEALFCQNDEIALGAYRALRECRIAVPDVVAIAGCDDVPYLAYLDTPITTLTLPIRESCRQAWRILQQRMAQPEAPAMQVSMEATVKLRASSERAMHAVVTDRISSLANQPQASGGQHESTHRVYPD
jgi:LacI family transcriptional regulator